MSGASSFETSSNAQENTPENKWEPQSPFIDNLSLSSNFDVRPPARGDTALASAQQTESPFLSMYEVGTGYEYISPKTNELFGILAELQDREFDVAVYQLQSEVFDLFGPRLEGEDDPSEYEVEQFFEGHFRPLLRETSAVLDSMASEFEGRDLTALSEPELDELLQRFEPEASGLSPSFEAFLGKVIKKAKKAVKKVVSAAKKGVVKAVKTVGKVIAAPVAMVLKKLKSLIKPLLQKVLKSGIGKLPESLQDAAKKAASKLFGTQIDKKDDVEETEFAEFEMEMQALVDGGSIATADDIGYVQKEFDIEIANLILADDETHQDLAIAEYESRSRRSGVDPRRRLKRARRKLARDLRNLRDGDDATPAVEQFIPAVLPVLKLGLKVIGRKRVIETLARLVSKLLQPFVGPKMTKPLADAIVGAGFRLIGLEMSEEDKADAAAAATAAVVEDTVRRVARLPAELLDDEIFLEAYVEEAFDHALGQNFPPMPRRPELMKHELPGGWQEFAEYKRYNLNPPVVVTITAKMAQDLKTFGGGEPTVLGHRLSTLVVTKATVRISEAKDGTWLSKITRDDDAIGLGGIEEYRWRSIHPLTTSAAAILLKDPGMGTDPAPQYLNDPNMIAIGQRFYYFEMDLTPGDTISQESAFYYVLDCPQGIVSVTLYLSETDAQAVAKHLRSRDTSKAGTELTKIGLRIAQRSITGDKFGDVVDIRRETIEIERVAPAIGPLLARLAKVLMPLLRWLVVKKLIPWLINWLVDRASQMFIDAADDPKEGITIKLTWNNPTLLDIICRLLNNENVSLKDLAREFKQLFTSMFSNLPTPQLIPGHHRD